MVHIVLKPKYSVVHNQWLRFWYRANLWIDFGIASTRYCDWALGNISIVFTICFFLLCCRFYYSVGVIRVLYVVVSFLSNWMSRCAILEPLVFSVSFFSSKCSVLFFLLKSFIFQTLFIYNSMFLALSLFVPIIKSIEFNSLKHFSNIQFNDYDINNWMKY